MESRLIHGEALDELRKLDSNSVDAIICDPPAGISFMGKEWDNPNYFPLRERKNGQNSTFGKSMTNGPEWSYSKKARDTFIAFLSEIMHEALRVLKPGGHALVWSIPRTSHWTATALEDAGFEIRDSIAHVFSQGFPKSLDIYKAASKAGLCCTCQIYDVQYPQTKEEVYHGKEDTPNDKDMQDLQSRMDSENSLSGCEKSDMQSSMQSAISKSNEKEQTVNYARLPELRSRIQTEKSYIIEESQVLQSSMQRSIQDERSGVCGTFEANSPNWTGGLVGRDEASVQPQEHGREQSSMEGWCNAQEDTRQLSGSDVCEMSTGVSTNGAQGWLCNGASASDGSTHGEMLNKGRSSTSHRSQSEQQSHQQLATIPEQRSAQTCGRCGKAIIQAGIGTALKPAHETWWLCRKPIEEDSIAANVLEWGVGALNIDATRIGTDEDTTRPTSKDGMGYHKGSYREKTGGHDQGRWPSNLLLSHTLLCNEEDGCAEDCPVAEMDRQSGASKSTDRPRNNNPHTPNAYGSFNGRVTHGHNDQGGASRYFQQFYYCAKASRRERNAGCEELAEIETSQITNRKPGSIGLVGNPDNKGQTGNPYASTSGAARNNHHPTVKPVALLRYFVRMITPPDGIVLDCFGGSGTTALACIAEHKRYILIEREEEYIEIARARINYALKSACLESNQNH
jgi:DNA modification methylase